MSGADHAGIMLHGVDFSGADSGGAAKIRVVHRDLGTPRAAVAAGGQFDRTALVRAVDASTRDGRLHLWRVDAPMGMALATIRQLGLAEDWRAVAEWMTECGGARPWRSRVRDTTRREPRRTCEQAMATPMASMNLRIFKQTWTFVCEVLLPLAESGVAIAPVLPRPGALVAVCEGCPASVLAAKGWAKRGYKGDGAGPENVRADLVRALRNEGMNIPQPLAEAAIADREGDQLDALILVSEPFQTVVPREAVVEGWVY